MMKTMTKTGNDKDNDNDKDNSASEMFFNLNIKSFGELLRVFVHGFRSRITISRNFMLSSICNSSCSVYSKLWAWWRTLLYVHL